MSSAPPAVAPAIREQAAPAMSMVSGTTRLNAHLGDPIDVVRVPVHRQPLVLDAAHRRRRDPDGPALGDGR